MNRKNVLIILLAVIFAGIIGYALYLYLGTDKRLSGENRQIKDDIEARQASVSRMDQEVGPPEGGLHPEKETVVSSFQQLRVVKESSAESQAIQDKTRDPQASGEEDTEPTEVSGTFPEPLPQSTEEEKRAQAFSEDVPGRANPTVIRRSAIALGVENREPRDVSEHVSVRQGRVYCWVHVINGQGGKITVRWIRKGRKFWETHLPIGSNNWRTWAYITLRPGMIGPAQADIVNEDGRLLQTLSFEITG